MTRDDYDRACAADTAAAATFREITRAYRAGSVDDVAFLRARAARIEALAKWESAIEAYEATFAEDDGQEGMATIE